MYATARVHTMNTPSNTKAPAKVNEARAAAARAVALAGVDTFVAEQVAVMQGQGHWADQVVFNQNGNSMAGISFVATAGQAREAVFAPHDYGNVFTMQVWALHDGSLRIEFSTRGDTRVLDVRRFAPADFNRDALADAYSAFVTAAVRKAAAKVH
jgi:hypothetical protein